MPDLDFELGYFVVTGEHGNRLAKSNELGVLARAATGVNDEDHIVPWRGNIAVWWSRCGQRIRSFCELEPDRALVWVECMRR